MDNAEPVEKYTMFVPSSQSKPNALHSFQQLYHMVNEIILRYSSSFFAQPAYDTIPSVRAVMTSSEACATLPRERPTVCI